METTKSLRDVVGSSHVAGKYNFTSQDYLNEGADKLLEMGSRVAKFWFTDNPKRDYPFNSDWPEITSMVGLAKTDHFRDLFAKPFTTFILEAFAPGHDNSTYEDGLSSERATFEREQMYELTKHLLTTYRGTGKTFILQNWEGDWILTNPDFTKIPHAKTIQGMIDWLAARQEGVEQARQEIGMDGVTVAHAAEVNLVGRAMDGLITVTNNVLPHTRCDLYTYSAYDTSLQSAEKFRDALNYLASKAPPSALFGKNNILVGEFGCPENEFPAFLEIIKRTVETALDWGALYVIYWELFCNEPARQYEGRPSNDDHRGFWLIRPDGTKSPVWDYFASLYAR